MLNVVSSVVKNICFAFSSQLMRGWQSCMLFVTIVSLCMLTSPWVVSSDRPVFNSGLIAAPARLLKDVLPPKNIDGPLPPRVDLSSRMPLPGDQGSQGSCVAWAVGYGARGYYLGLNGTDLRNKNQLPSPAYIYNQIKALPFSCDLGSAIPDALALLKNQGVATLGEFAYNERTCAKQPDPNIKAMARRNTISDWRTISTRNLSAVKSELYKGNPVIFGMRIDDTFMKHFGEKTYVNRSGAIPWGGHAMVIVGYDDMRSAFKIFNSWGQNWGSGGTAWVDYETMRKRAMDFYVMEVKVQPPPSPAPDVVPPDGKVDPAPVPPSPFQPPGPDEGVPKAKDIKDATKKIDILLAGVDCARIEASVDTWGIVHLKGFIGKEEQLSKLMSTILGLRGIRNVESSVRVTPWPLCEAYLAMDPVSKTNKKISATIVDHPDNVLAVGDLFGVEIKTPKTPGYLYVTYLQSNGQAVKFFWGKPYTPGQTVSLGGPGYKISAPLGKELLLVIASAKPLWEEESPDVTKPDKQFLSALKKAINELKPGEQGKVSYAAVEILTQAP